MKKGYIISLFCICICISTLPGSIYAQTEPPAAPAEPGQENPVDANAPAPEPVAPPQPPPLPVPQGELTVHDMPNDNGTSIVVEWNPAADYPLVEAWEFALTQQTEKGAHDDKKVAPTGKAPYQAQFTKLQANTEVTVSVKAIGKDATSPSSAPVTGKPKGNFFNLNRINSLLALGLYLILVLIFVKRAKMGKSLFIRRIAGLDAVEEAVGRATEMGRSILYVPGLSTMSDVATIAALNLLGPIAQKVATYDTKLIVPNRDPIVYTVAHEVVKNAFGQAGRPDLFTDDNVFFITDSQFGFAAAVDGIIVRERPATNFFMGMFWAESLVMAETGASTGAIQIAGTDAVTQLPFFIVSCDYTLIGEELYAASAYLGKDPVLRGTLKAQDIMKMVLLGLIATGIVLAALNSYAFYAFLGNQ